MPALQPVDCFTTPTGGPGCYWTDGIWDENYTTVNSTGYYFTYVKPPGATAARLKSDIYIWQNSHSERESEVPQACWDEGSTIQLWVHQGTSPRCGPPGQWCMYIDCFDGATWDNRVTGSGSVSSTSHFNKIYEEAIIWTLH